MSKWPNYPLVFVFLFVLFGRLEGATYYISTDGNDGNSGVSPEQAWRSIEKVNGKVFSPGDKILFEGGKTFSGGIISKTGGTPSRPITVGSYGDGRATISSSDEKGFNAQECAGFDIKDLIFIGSKNPDLERWEHHGIQFRHSDGGEHEEHIYIDNVEISGYMIGIEIGCKVENNTGYKDVRITNSDIHNNWDKAILIYGHFPRQDNSWANTDVYIADCTLHNNPGIADSPDVVGNGIEVGNTQNGLIEFCQPHGNGQLRYGKDKGPLGVMVWESANVAIQYCESHHNINGGGYLIGGGARDCIAQYNYSHDNHGAGYLVWNGKSPYHDAINNTYRYNISEGDGFKNGYGAITFGTSGDIFNTVIYNNTMYVGAGSTGACVIVWSGMIYNTNLRNNIFMTAAGKKVLLFLYTTGGWNFQGNCYWSSGTPIQVDWAGTVYTGLDSWRSAVGQEMLNGSAVGLEINPQLTNPGGGRTLGDPRKLSSLTAYKLQETSVLIDSGLDLQKLFGINPGMYDFYGTSIPQGAGYDIGAHEYSPVTAEVAMPEEVSAAREPVFEATEQDGYRLAVPLPFSVFHQNEIEFKVEHSPGILPPEEVLFHILHLGEIEAERQEADESYSYVLDGSSLSDGRLFVKAEVSHEGRITEISGGWDERGIPILLDRHIGYKKLMHNSKYIESTDDPSVFMSELARRDFIGNNNRVSFCSAWNREFLHLGFWIEDAHLNVAPLPPVGDGQISDYTKALWAFDGIEVCLNTGGDRSEWRRLNDFELVVNVAGEYRAVRWDDKEQKILHWGERVNIKTECNGTINDNKDEDKGYHLLISIPWDQLDYSVRRGDMLGFDVRCFDRDLGDETYYVSWSGERFGNSDNPSEWGSLILQPQPFGRGGVIIALLVVFTAGLTGFLINRNIKINRAVIAGQTKAEQETEKKSREDRLVAAIKSFVLQNYQEPDLNRGLIAKHLHLSKDHITHVFKKETGIRLIDYVNQVRINRAKELLKDERLNITEVGFSVGYNTLRHFYKNFKKITGKTPSEYRSSV